MSEDRELMGKGAPPMANGELIFDAPWQSRTFGMARVLCERGYFAWDEFRAELIREVADWEATHDEMEPYHYYDLFLAALTRLMLARGLCAPAELSAREQEFAARPHGHDH